MNTPNTITIDARILECAVASLKNMAFMLESVAHLQGKEREILPQTDYARALVKKLQPMLGATSEATL